MSVRAGGERSAGPGSGVSSALTFGGRGGRGVPSPIWVTGVDGILGVSNSGRRGAGNCRRPPAFPGLPLKPRCPPELVFLQPLSRTPVLSLRVPALSLRLFLSPSSLSSLGSFLYRAALGGFRLSVSLCPISLLFTRSILQFGARRILCPKSGSSRTPSPPFRPPPRNPGHREGPRLAPLAVLRSGLSDRPGPSPRRCPWAKCSKHRRFLQDLPAFLCSVFSSQGHFSLESTFSSLNVS